MKWCCWNVLSNEMEEKKQDKDWFEALPPKLGEEQQ